jgi:putative nucleotidyltransferase with HDIG domain
LNATETRVNETEFLERLFTALQDDKLVLPTLPEIALSIRDLVANEDSSLADLCKLINKDTALTARLIQIANSPIFLTNAATTSVDAAVKRLGRNVVNNIVTGVAMEQLFQATTEITDRKLRQCWQHALEVSAIAATFSQQIPHLKADQAMLAGLTHDIGVLPILTMAEDYPELLADEAALDALIESAHAKIGTAILKKWSFPEPIIMAVKHHEDLMFDSGAKPDYVDLLIVANLQSSDNAARLAAIPDMSVIPAFAKLGLGEIEVIDMYAPPPAA